MRNRLYDIHQIMSSCLLRAEAPSINLENFPKLTSNTQFNLPFDATSNLQEPT